MTDKNKNIDLIERYLADELSGKELELFEKLRSEDPEFQKQVDEMAGIIECAKESARNSLLDDLKKLEESLPEVEVEENGVNDKAFTSIGKTRKLYWKITQYVAIAASLTGLFFGVVRPQYQFTRNPAEFRHEPVPLMAMNISIDRGDEISSNSLLELASLYEGKKYRKIISSLKNAENKSEEHLMLLGNSYFQKKNYKKASDCFMLKNFSIHSKLLDDASFSLALCYIALGQKDNAKIILLDLANTEGDFSKVSKQILQKKSLIK